MKFLRTLALTALVVLSVSLIYVPIHVPQVHAQSGSAIPDAHLTLTAIDVPGVSITEINGINTAGDMVGFSGDNLIGPLSGFLYRSGTFTSLDYPGQTVTVPSGINDSGIIVGYATQNADQRTSILGFLYDGSTFTTLKDGANSVTEALGINNAGVVVGSAGSLNATKAIELVNGRYKTINFPGSYIYAFGNGIDNHGLIVGSTFGVPDTAYIAKKGQFRNVEFPGSRQTAAWGVGDNGIVVGWYNPFSGTDFAFVFKNGRFLSFTYPGAKGTYAAGINASGQIVGSYTLDFQAYHGFVTSPIAAADFQ